MEAPSWRPPAAGSPDHARHNVRRDLEMEEHARTGPPPRWRHSRTVYMPKTWTYEPPLRECVLAHAHKSIAGSDIDRRKPRKFGARRCLAAPSAWARRGDASPPLDSRMPLRPLYGHEPLRARLAAAAAAGRLPQALLFEGPRGVGKQRLALWLAQGMVCEGEARRENGEGCGACQPCRLVLNLSHPDVHWFVPVEITRKGADADKQVELVRDALVEEMAARREQPLYQAPSGLATHGIASVRLLLRQLHLTPALAHRKVFIVGDAERLVPQRANPDAANALLKALEEPPPDTWFVLTSSQPDALLPTIVSRVVRVRVARVPDSVLTEFAQRELGNAAQGNVAQLVTASEGCVGRLLALAGADGPGNDAPAEALLQATRA